MQGFDSEGVRLEARNRSEVQSPVTVASPDDHRDGETEHGGQGRPTQSEQHELDRLTDGILPRVRHLFVRPEATVMTSSSPGSSAVLERQETTQRYPQARVIVLDDDVNTFQHVVDCLRKIIPGMSEDNAWNLANRIDGQGSAEVWCGPLEQAELYHQQLQAEGLTMAPLERC